VFNKANEFKPNDYISNAKNLKAMNKIIYILILTFAIGNSQTQSQDSIKNEELYKRALEIIKRDSSEVDNSIYSEMTSIYHNTNNTDFGSSKYDKDINWAASIDENDVQGSLDKYRAYRREEDFKVIGYIVLKVIGVISLILISIYVFFFKKRL
jgi:hypothetical protein